MSRKRPLLLLGVLVLVLLIIKAMQDYVEQANQFEAESIAHFYQGPERDPVLSLLSPIFVPLFRVFRRKSFGLPLQ